MILILILLVVLAVVGGLLLHASMKVQQYKTKAYPLFLYGFHEDGTPIKGWHELK
jgi:hypothetical protein